MKTSESVKEIFTALAAAQAAFPVIRRDSDNSHLGSKYADLAAILEAVRKPLADNALALVQTSEARCELLTQTSGGRSQLEGVVVITTLIHSSGEWIRGELLMPLDVKDPRKTGPQQAAASFTFGRRHALMAILGIAAETEDEPAPGALRTSGTSTGEPLSLAAAAVSLKGFTTAKACIDWRNNFRREIQASAEREKIQEEFTRVLNELKKKEGTL